jgi:glyoxylase-like metal-dependent hydrolase (beta-lactamase superfamily II)
MLLNPIIHSDINAISGRASPSYVINGESIIVVDVCFPSDAKTILTFVHSTLRRDVKDIKYIVLTHSHIDHINGVDYLANKTQATIVAHEKAQKYLTGGRAIPLARFYKLWEFLCFLRKYSFPRPSLTDIFTMPWSGIPKIKKGIHSKNNQCLLDGDSLPDHPEWKVIHTPGHTDDSICLYSAEYKSLITGDTVVNMQGQLVLNPLLKLDNEALTESFNKLKQLEVDNIYPGWGSPVFGKDLISRISVDTLEK